MNKFKICRSDVSWIISFQQGRILIEEVCFCCFSVNVFKYVYIVLYFLMLEKG